MTHESEFLETAKSLTWGRATVRTPHLAQGERRRTDGRGAREAVGSEAPRGHDSKLGFFSLSVMKRLKEFKQRRVAGFF